MHKKIIILLAVTALGLTYVGCQAPATETDVEAIKRVLEQSFTAFNAGDIEGILAVNTDDVVWIPPNHPPITGKEALRSWEQDYFDEFAIQVAFSHEEIVVTGDWAFLRYSFAATLTLVAGGESTQDNGHGLTIYQRQPDGSWKYFRNIWNSDNPPAGTQ
jgi:uncharacterized protein (TIGR02246 family)